MFTHMLNPRNGKYVLLQNMQLKRRINTALCFFRHTARHIARARISLLT
jgi:hypothetical protein